MNQHEPYEEFESLLDMVLALCRYLAMAALAVLAAGVIGGLVLLRMGV